MESISERLPKVFNVAAYFLESSLAAENSQRVALFYQDKTYTYSQLNCFVQRAAQVFLNFGLEQENRVAILLPDTPELVFAFWGAIWLGIIPVPINTACSVDEVQYILQDSRAKLLITTQDWQAKLAPISSAFLQHRLLQDGETPFLSLLTQQADEAVPCAKTLRDEPAFWLYTSGSTGKPKGVIHLHQSMVVCAENYAKSTLKLHREDITYSVANMPFAYGLGNTLYMPMAVGSATILSDASNAFDIVADIQRYKPTVFFGIPSVYANLLAVQEIAPLDASSLRLCVSAAEQLPESIWRQWQETYNQEICEGIGTTEFLHIFLSNPSGACKPGTSGRPVPGYEVQVLDDRGHPCAAGEIGNLVVSGESLMLGYWNRLRETRQALYGTTMRTGDKYQFDADGYFKFMGRQDDLFKVNGQWVSPMEIEDVLHQHPQVLEVAIVPESADGEQLTQVVAYVSLKSGQTPSPELEVNLCQFAKQRLPHFKAPKVVRFVEHLPRTPTGKIHRKAIANYR
ncbi:MAG: benzoate-CoA ligase family protein [Drouetiella hepatica Uher 2000/2452]|jgi:benzoate-CoA ligase family protein|uniref:Benzoate-CoA ligase family protein n=1 Tax=Drouetiella hepatica Uher 2000/2452 TaxID=904376 RepID=A0A951QDH5_9CYAN|nr:benzoate-CoA ligase family protein [Drouetiella hepatica Uher 2000/2452]